MNLTSPKVIKEICAQFGFGFSKGLGQNFLLDANVLEQIAEAAGDVDAVIEIGPGFGVLTRELSKLCKTVLSIEIDQRLYPILDYTLSDCPNVEIIPGDVMKLDISELISKKLDKKRISVAANLPYYITTPILTMLIESRLPFENIVVMIQKEVAQRICAKPGSKDYGAISVLCQYYTNPELLCVVPAGSFLPPPKVDSAVLRMQVLPEPKVHTENEALFFRVVKAAFSQRRKTLLNCLSNNFPLDKNTLTDCLEGIGIQPTIRGEKLGLEEFASITKALQSIL